MFDDVIKRFRGDDLNIDFVDMTLTQRDAETPIVFKGKGLIKQGDKGRLEFKLFATEVLNINVIDHLNSMFSSTAGKVIADDQYYDLSGRDAHNQNWFAERIQYSATWSGGDMPIISGPLRHISVKAASRISSHSTSVETFHELDFPSRFARQMMKAPIDSTFDACGATFEVHQFDGGFKISARADGPLDEDFYLRIIEGLKFVTARPVQPRVVSITAGNETTLYLLSTTPVNPRIQQFPPLSPGSWEYARDSIVLFRQYVEYIDATRPGENWHLITELLDNAAQATGGSRQSWGVGLGVAVEGLSALVPFEIDPKERESMVKAREWIGPLLDAEPGLVHLKTRIVNKIDSLLTVRPTDRMQVLIDLKLVNPLLRKAWQKLRNKSVHPDAESGGAVGDQDVQPIYDMICKSTVLMYLIVFYLIEYKGDYTNYAVHDFPQAAFPPPTDDEGHLPTTEIAHGK